MSTTRGRDMLYAVHV